jgi:hypothetical protein
LVDGIARDDDAQVRLFLGPHFPRHMPESAVSAEYRTNFLAA